MLKSLTGLRHAINAEKRNETATKSQKEYNQARREERAMGSQLCQECGHKIRHENWDAHFHSLCITSELGTKCLDERLFNEIR